MSEAPLAPICRHCGATNDSVASECWLCQRRDWREPTGARSKAPRLRPAGDPRATFTGCMVVVAIALLAIVGLAFRVGRIAGVIALILGALVYAVAIALFAICMAFTAA